MKLITFNSGQPTIDLNHLHTEHYPILVKKVLDGKEKYIGMVHFTPSVAKEYSWRIIGAWGEFPILKSYSLEMLIANAKKLDSSMTFHASNA